MIARARTAIAGPAERAAYDVSLIQPSVTTSRYGWRVFVFELENVAVPDEPSHSYLTFAFTE